MSNYSNDPLFNLSYIFKALGNPSRLKIFLRLASCCRPGSISKPRPLNYVGELGSDLGLAPSTLSHHLKELQSANLIQTRRSGQNIECWVTPETLDGLADFFEKAGYE